MKLFVSKGFTMVETLASIVIITFVFTTALTIIVNLRKTTLMTNERIVAVSVAKMIRDEIENNYLYDDLNLLIDSGDYMLTNDNCTITELTGVCDLFSYNVEGRSYSDSLSILFLEPDEFSINYGLIHFYVEIVYYEDTSITIEGVIYG
jgi:competence protein ComGC